MSITTTKQGLDVLQFLREKGYNPPDSTWYTHIDEWRSWYRGKVEQFHNYRMYNGTKYVNRERQTLAMAKKVCEDKADLLLNERCRINVSNDKSQQKLDDVLDDNMFWVRGNQLIEIMAAMGTGATVEYLDAGRIRIDYVQANMIYPLVWDNGAITECAFASFINKKDGRYTYIQMHVKDDDGQYIVYNFLFDPLGTEITLDPDDPNGLVPVWPTGGDVPLFQIFKPNAVNNLDSHNPMGMSIYANALDILKGIDLVYDSYDNEFRLGKKRIFVRDSVMRWRPTAGGDAEMLPVFDDRDTEFYALEMKDDEDSIHEVNMELRSEEHELGLQRRLDLLSEKCGFGKGYYKADADAVITATGVISQNSQLYRRIRKDELVIEHALTQMVEAIFHLTNDVLEMGVPDPGDITIGFDDSIVEDTDAVAKRSLLEFQAGIISGAEYLRRVYDLTDKQAEEMIAEAAAEKAANTPPAPDPNNLFPDVPKDGAPGSGGPGMPPAQPPMNPNPGSGGDEM